MSTTSLPKRKRLFSRLREKISIPCIGSSEAHHSPPSPTPSGESINQHPYGGIGQRIPSPNLRFSKSFHSRPPSPLPDSKYAVEPLEVHLGDKLDVGYGNLKDSDGRNLSLATTSGASGSQTGGYGDVKKVEEPEELEPISNIHPQEAEVQVSSQPPLPAVAIQDVDSNAPAVAEEIKKQDQEKREDTEDTVMDHGRKEAPELTVGAMLTISPPTSPPPPPAINTLSPLTPTPAISLQPPSPASPHASSSPITFDSPTSDDIVRKKSLNNGNSANAPPPEVLTFDLECKRKWIEGN
ncbi:hypothetical protein BT69DRAFT_286955 [Atractiella rhizophila]|nr:hypothetical protein BT69DRAFT_286955 [Atractiella rhizophila]